MKYLMHKELIKTQALALRNRGGKYQLAANKVFEIFGIIQMGAENPFNGLKQTKNGETRIKYCIKYDLNGFCRLITIRDNGIHALVYFGDHKQCDKWLDANKGYTLTVKNDSLRGLKITSDIDDASPSQVQGTITDGTLLSKLRSRYLNVIMDSVRASVYRRLEVLDSFSSEDEILRECSNIKTPGVQEMVLDVLIALKEDDEDKARDRILLFEEHIKKLEDATKEEVEAVTSGEEYILLEDFNGKDIQHIMDGASWMEWMLFMHPQQRKVVNEDFKGPARLLGVSGSGKTCVTVNRAIRLAKKYPGELILVTTINPALALLIDKLVEIAISTEREKEVIASQIIVKSLSDVKRELLLQVEENQLKRKSLNEYTHKHLEDVDQVWKEFYLCENNNNDAKVLTDVHRTLLNRNILPLQYVKEEFDWIRSALFPSERLDYLTIEREGRSEPLTKEYRICLLEGLKCWEQKMQDVGVSDYLGLVGSLSNYIEEIKPSYRCILVDELQDFGTTELTIIRKLVKENENDLFLCGDIAQRVHTKQHKLNKASIEILPQNYRKILKNYRNSKQILEAAASVFHSNIEPEDYNSKDFELLNPEYANFSSPKPFLRHANSFYEELDYGIKYLMNNLSSKEKGCIAICGYSYFQVKNLGDKLNINVLDGIKDIESGTFFLSDLNQTKGYEFDIVIIVNCGKGIIPNIKIPAKEHFREISKLYVSMTRAKKELIISESSGRSKIFNNSIPLFNTDTNWEDYVELGKDSFSLKVIQGSFKEEIKSLKNQLGHDYLYSDSAIGLSHSSQDKLIQLVNGVKTSDHKGMPETWKNMNDFINSLNGNLLTPHLNKLLGSSVYKELKERFAFDVLV